MFVIGKNFFESVKVAPGLYHINSAGRSAKKCI